MFGVKVVKKARTPINWIEKYNEFEKNQFSQDMKKASKVALRSLMSFTF